MCMTNIILKQKYFSFNSKYCHVIDLICSDISGFSLHFLTSLWPKIKLRPLAYHGFSAKTASYERQLVLSDGMGSAGENGKALPSL